MSILLEEKLKIFIANLLKLIFIQFERVFFNNIAYLLQNLLELGFFINKKD